MLAIIGFLFLIGLGVFLLFVTYAWIMMVVGFGSCDTMDWFMWIIPFALACGSFYLAIANAPFTITFTRG